MFEIKVIRETAKVGSLFINTIFVTLLLIYFIFVIVELGK